MTTRWYREQLPRLEFQGERGAFRWVPLTSEWADQAVRVQLVISGRITGDTQDTGYVVSIAGCDGVQQPGADGEGVGYALTEFNKINLGGPLYTGQDGEIQLGYARFQLIDPSNDELQYRWPVLALYVAHLIPEDPDALVGDPDFLTGTVFYEVEV